MDVLPTRPAPALEMELSGRVYRPLGYVPDTWEIKQNSALKERMLPFGSPEPRSLTDVLAAKINECRLKSLGLSGTVFTQLGWESHRRP